MNKELKKCYYLLDLPFSATIEQVQQRTKILIKILRAKAMKHGVSYADKINEIAYASSEIVENIKKNGIPNVKVRSFETSIKDLKNQLLVMIIFAVVFAVSLIALI